MKFKMTGIKAKLASKCICGVAVGMSAMLGMAPMTAFAGGIDTECYCEEKCTVDNINPDCAICGYDYSNCEGTEAEENWGPLTPDGNMNLVDDYGSMEAGGKQFITLTTKAGNFFYLIIDRDDQGQETVHFLNLVDEADLLSLMDDEEVEKYMKAMGMNVPTEEEKTPVVEEKEPEPEAPVEVVEEVEKEPANVTGIMAVVLALALAGGGGYLYFKSEKMKKPESTGPDPDEDYDEDADFSDYLDDDDDYQVDMEEIAEEEDVEEDKE